MRRLLLLVLIVSAIIPVRVGAYGVETHAAITLEIARFFNQHYPHRAFTQAEMKILAAGAIDEDDGARPLNHFYDPIHRRGLDYMGQHLASKHWAQDAGAQVGTLGKALALVISPAESTDYTWKRAIEDYAAGRTERGLEGLGHVLHLIEDLTVPAHVRNDPHPPKDSFGEKIGDDDPYELWSHKFNTRNINILVHLREKKPISGLGSLNKYFDELATYTNSRFFSKDTIGDGGFALPNLNILSRENSGKLNLYRNQEDALVAVGIANPFSGISVNMTTDDERVSQSTWDRLSPKAVQYGAGVVDLFFNEVEKLKKDPKFTGEVQKSLLGQFIDSVGDNIGALIEGAPEPQPVVVTKIAVAPIIEIPEEEPAPVPASNLNIAPLAPVIVAEPQPVVIAPPPKVIAKASGGSGGSDEEVEEVVSEEIGEPEVPEIVEPEPVTVPPPAPDITPPAGVADLDIDDVRENSIILRWTAPGDDGNEGTAISYEIRYGTSEITNESWSMATVLPGTLVPQAAGANEEVEISGLAPATAYYIALKTKDEAGNESTLSNVVSAKTLMAEPSYVVISEVYPDMTGADAGEFVELYNPTDAPIDISGYSLQYLSGSATAFTGITKKNFTAGAVIPAKGFYLIGMSGNAAVDMSWSEQLHNTGATIFLVSSQVAIADALDVTIVDRVAYGTGTGLLGAEGSAAPLPGEGKSIERRAFKDGVCVPAAASGEFLGNACDTDDNSADFEIRVTAKPQRTTNLFEPRSAPSAVNDVAVAQLQFTWPASLDASDSSSGLIYRIMDVSNAEAPVQLYSGAGLSYAYATNEIGRELKVTIQAIDRDGLGSDVVDLSVDIPSYLSEVVFYPDAGGASGSPTYSTRLSWDSYPFVPVGTGFWHLAVFYYNEDAKKLPFLGQLNSGHNWGTGVSMPSVFKTSYANCIGSVTTGASLILADEAAKCSYLFGGVRSQAIDFGLLRDKTIILPVLAQTFGGTSPTPGESYITVAFYTYTPGGALGSDMRLVAVDKTRYYLSE